MRNIATLLKKIAFLLLTKCKYAHYLKNFAKNKGILKFAPKTHF